MLSVALRVAATCGLLCLLQPAVNAGDFFVVTRQDRATSAWAWEIQRRSKPLGVRPAQGGFPSQSAARLAGEKALRYFLDGLAEEEKNGPAA